MRKNGKPNRGQFKPGASATEAGAAGGAAFKSRRPITQTLISFLNEVVPGTSIPKIRRMCDAIINQAMSGDMEAVKFITERVEGKVPQAVEMTGRDGGPMEVIDRTLTPQQAAQAYAATLGSEDAGLDGEGASVH
jgi:hypothetical protein